MTPLRVTVVPSGSSAARHVVALLDSWNIRMFTDHVLRTRAKSCWCCISYAVTQDYFGGWGCGWVWLVRRQPGRKMESENVPRESEESGHRHRSCVTVTTSRSSLLSQNLLSNQPYCSNSLSRYLHCHGSCLIWFAWNLWWFHKRKPHWLYILYSSDILRCSNHHQEMLL